MAHDILVGSHISSAGGLHKAFERGESIGCTAMQIFTKSNRVWFEKKITDEAAELFKQAAQRSPIKSVVVHAGYLINIGSPKPDGVKQSVSALLDEIRRCEQLGLKYLILHPGSHLGSGEEAGVVQVAKHLDEVIEKSDGTVSILLETMAGQGTNLGSTFEQLHAMRERSTHKRNIGYCLDTCHIFCAGYNIATEDSYQEAIKTFDTTLGLEHLKAIHVNDSLTPCASRKDRHAPLGEGHIPNATFKLMMNDKRLINIPKVLETPSDPEMHLWAKEIKMLKAMID